MSLNNSDKLIVQRPSGEKTIFSVTLNTLYDYIAAHPTLNYRGLIDLTQSPSGQITPDPSVVGDIYINNTDGQLASGYTGLTAGTIVSVDDRLVFDGIKYELIQGGGLVGVETVTGQAPIVVDNTDPANPVVELPAIDGGEYAIVITGVVSSVGIDVVGTGYQNGIIEYETEAISGSGTGLTVEVRYSSDVWTPGYLFVVNGGSGYSVGDQVRVLGGNNDKVIEITSTLDSVR